MGESRTPWMPGWNTATFVLYHRRTIGTSRAIARLRLPVQHAALLVVGHRRRLVDQAIDVGVHVVRAVQAARRHLAGVEDAAQHVGIGHADELRACTSGSCP